MSPWVLILVFLQICGIGLNAVSFFSLPLHGVSSAFHYTWIAGVTLFCLTFCVGIMLIFFPLKVTVILWLIIESGAQVSTISLYLISRYFDSVKPNRIWCFYSVPIRLLVVSLECCLINSKLQGMLSGRKNLI